MEKKRVFFAFVGCLLLTLTDQLTKFLTVRCLKNGADVILIPGILSLTYVENRGAAFGIFQDGRILFFITTAVMLAAFGWCYGKLLRQRSYGFLRVLCVILMAGGVGNLTDRIFRGYVVDMIYFMPINFPVFNVADCYITVSVILLVAAVLFVYKDDDFSFLKPSRKGKN